MSEFSYEKLLEALDLHHNILHAEQQAIAARDLNSVEDILARKDKSLDLLLLAKKAGGDSNYPAHIQSRITSVLSLQQKNSQNFKKLHIQDDQPSDSVENSNPLFRRLKKAYSR